jgi:hypothetical protein
VALDASTVSAFRYSVPKLSAAARSSATLTVVLASVMAALLPDVVAIVCSTAPKVVTLPAWASRPDST